MEIMTSLDQYLSNMDRISSTMLLEWRGKQLACWQLQPD